jgi:uncharacterized protein (DUF305 family)
MLTAMKARIVATTLSALVALAATRPAQALLSDSGFVTQTRDAMSKMMAAMDVKPSGDVDRDFVLTMVPHHQGAIDMAESELRFGNNIALRRIAQEIIVTQKDEIVAMRRALIPTLAADPGKHHEKWVKKW